MSKIPKKTSRKGIIRVVSSCSVLVIIIILFLYYIKPATVLHLQYESVPLSTKIWDSVEQGKLQIEFTETEINHLLKKYIKAEINEYTRILGADFKLVDQGIHAILHLQFFERIDAHVEAKLSVQWTEPYLQIQPQSLQLKQIPLPPWIIKSMVFPIELPFLDIIFLKDFMITTDRLTLQFGLRLPQWLSD
ncbi:hypothetical protein ACFSTH_02690 [Paenibacillus yanchengensis]|uniref:DUF2140 family protein n=1 Tax=Paenibacillus yanchengensis TaxID=2035833 RepID=A0ABW4YGZ6_9BACL